MVLMIFQAYIKPTYSLHKAYMFLAKSLHIPVICKGGERREMPMFVVVNR